MYVDSEFSQAQLHSLVDYKIRRIQSCSKSILSHEKLTVIGVILHLLVCKLW